MALDYELYPPSMTRALPPCRTFCARASRAGGVAALSHFLCARFARGVENRENTTTAPNSPSSLLSPSLPPPSAARWQRVHTELSSSSRCPPRGSRRRSRSPGRPSSRRVPVLSAASLLLVDSSPADERRRRRTASGGADAQPARCRRLTTVLPGVFVRNR